MYTSVMVRFLSEEEANEPERTPWGTAALAVFAAIVSFGTTYAAITLHRMPAESYAIAKVELHRTLDDLRRFDFEGARTRIAAEISRHNAEISARLQPPAVAPAADPIKDINRSLR